MTCRSGTTARCWWAVITLVLAILAGPAATELRAQTAGEQNAVIEAAGDGPVEDLERWWGAVGAVLCGAEIRLVRVAPAVGMNPYAIAAGLAGCLLAGLDVLTTR
jgi:hypothetical protein